MNDQRSLRIAILGKNYSIVTDEDSGVLNDAAHLVDSLMRQMTSTPASSAGEVKKITFVALQLAVDLIKKQKESASVVDRTQALTCLLEETLSNQGGA